MTSVEVFKTIYYSFLKPEPPQIVDTLGRCLSQLSAHNPIPQVLQICDLSSSPLQKAAQDIVKKWMERTFEFITLPTASGQDRIRSAGLALLAKTISQSSFELMHSYSEKISALLLGIMNRKHESELVLGAAAVTLSTMICRGANWDQTRREFLKDAVFGTFLNRLLKCMEERPVEGQQGMITALQILLSSKLKLKFPYERILRILLKIVSTSFSIHSSIGQTLYLASMKCIPLLADSGLIWISMLQQFIFGIHCLLDKLFVGFNSELSQIRPLRPQIIQLDAGKLPLICDVFSIPLSSEVRPLSTQSTVPIDLHHICSLTQLIQLMLNSKSNLNVEIPVFDLLVVVRSLIALDGSHKSNETLYGLTNGELLQVVPTLHLGAYQLLETLLQSLNSAVFPYVVPITDIITHVIQCGRNPSCFALAIPEIKQAQFRLAQTFLQIFHSCSSGLVSLLLPFALEDLYIEVSSGSGTSLSAPRSSSQAHQSANPSGASGVVLTSSSADSTAKVNPNKQKAANKALSDPRSHVNADTLGNLKAGGPSGDGLSNAPRSKANDFVRIEAFNTISCALENTGRALNEDLRSKIDRVLIGQAITLSRHPSQRLWKSPSFPPAFASSKVREALFNALISSVLVCSRVQAPTLPYAIRLLSMGIGDPDPQVAMICYKGVNICSSIVHPRMPLLAPSISDESRTSNLSMRSINLMQTEIELLQQQEELNVRLSSMKKATQVNRRARPEDGEGESDNEMTDGNRPLKKHKSDHNPASVSSPSVSSLHGVFKDPAFEGIDTKMMQIDNQANPPKFDSKPSQHSTLSSKTDSKPIVEQNRSTIGSSGMDDDIEIVDEDPDSEDD